MIIKPHTIHVIDLKIQNSWVKIKKNALFYLTFIPLCPTKNWGNWINSWDFIRICSYAYARIISDWKQGINHLKDAIIQFQKLWKSSGKFLRLPHDRCPSQLKYYYLRLQWPLSAIQNLWTKYPWNINMSYFEPRNNKKPQTKPQPKTQK